MKTSKISLYLVDDHNIFLDAFKSFISIKPEFVLIGHHSGCKLDIAEIISKNPQVVILDYYLQNNTGLYLLKSLRQNSFPGKIVFLSMTRDPKIKNALIQHGSDGFVHKETDGEIFLNGIKGLVNNHFSFLEIPEISKSQKVYKYFLTPKEFEICQLICSGFSSEEIKDKLFISIHTLHTHRRRILEKTESENFIQVCQKLTF